MNAKRKIEVFSAGSPAYEETIGLVNHGACSCGHCHHAWPGVDHGFRHGVVIQQFDHM